MEVIVADDQLSLAIGKKGQNVRLAAKLTGWKIDVRSESKEEKITGESFERLLAVEGMDEETATILFDNGYRNPEDIARASLAELTSFMGITEEKGLTLLHGAMRYVANPPQKKRPEEESKDEEEPLEAEAPEEEPQAESGLDEEDQGDLGASSDEAGGPPEEVQASADDGEVTEGGQTTDINEESAGADQAAAEEEAVEDPAPDSDSSHDSQVESTGAVQIQGS
jgi:N utilization substance protein A